MVDNLSLFKCDLKSNRLNPQYGGQWHHINRQILVSISIAAVDRDNDIKIINKCGGASLNLYNLNILFIYSNPPPLLSSYLIRNTIPDLFSGFIPVVVYPFVID